MDADERSIITELLARIEALEADRNQPGVLQGPQNPVSRANVLKTAAMGAAALTGAGALLQHNAGVAGATGSEGQTTFTSHTSNPTVSVSNTSSGLAIETNAGIKTSEFMLAKRVTATNPFTDANANAITGRISSTAAGSFSAGVRGQNLSTTEDGVGVYGSQNGSGYGVYGTSTGGGYGGVFTAGSGGGTGVFGHGDLGVWGTGGSYGGYFNGSVAVNGIGEYGGVFQGSGVGNTGVFGLGSGDAFGVYAQSDTASAVYATTSHNAAIYGYCPGQAGGVGVLGEADGEGQEIGVFGIDDSGQGHAVLAWGNFAATGTTSAIVPAADGTERKLYCIESPECWFEDFGSAQLVNGHASVTIDPVFAGVVHADLFHIFLTAKGDSKGLYVSAQSASGFEVREQEGGKSSLTFSYRVVARRKDVVAPRLEQVAKIERPIRPAPRIPPQPTLRTPRLDPNAAVDVVQDRVP